MHRVAAALILVAALALVALPAATATAGGHGGGGHGGHVAHGGHGGHGGHGHRGGIGGFGGGYGYAPIYGNGWWPYTQGYMPLPPYFSVHPPVYYSHPVPRPYGMSPYPYTPRQEPAYVIEPQPQEIVNPYVTGLERSGEGAAEPAIDTDRAASYGRMVINPYVEQPGMPRLAEAE